MTMANDDPFHLQRFVDAQATTYAQARAELAEGEKRTHWMWFIFPQIRGLGNSSMAQRYAIANLDEAKAYLQHPVLGERLRVCTVLVNAIEGRTLDAIFGYPDNLKFHSSMTLFARASERQNVFTDALARYFDGCEDGGTIRQLSH